LIHEVDGIKNSKKEREKGTEGEKEESPNSTRAWNCQPTENWALKKGNRHWQKTRKEATQSMWKPGLLKPKKLGKDGEKTKRVFESVNVKKQSKKEHGKKQSRRGKRKKTNESKRNLKGEFVMGGRNDTHRTSSKWWHQPSPKRNNREERQGGKGGGDLKGHERGWVKKKGGETLGLPDKRP